MVIKRTLWYGLIFIVTEFHTVYYKWVKQYRYIYNYTYVLHVYDVITWFIHINNHIY